MVTTVNMSGPGTATITDDSAAAIQAQTSAITAAMNAQLAMLTRIQGTLATVTEALGSISDHSKASGFAIGKLQGEVRNMATAVNSAAVTQDALASSTIQKNTFDTEVTKQGMKNIGEVPPVLPSTATQIQAHITLSQEIDKIKAAGNLVVQKVEAAIQETLNIPAKVIDQGLQKVTNQIDQQVDAILAPINAFDPQTISRNLAAAAGVPSGK